MVLGGGALGRQLGHECEAVLNGICGLIKEAPESPRPLSYMRTQGEGAIYELDTESAVP